ncbi:hypothetical protein E4T56_gene12792 [Termitomyces sp. T112]|nr:hypothetical protein E4T56_gene12792 [Termitomyces sp. T112]
MSAAPQPTSAWTEPPWSGWIETTGDALLILEAARRGLIPRVTRRLVDSERKMICSGSVFVFDEDESGIKRWTDGFFWSPSRILGNFLLYRETDKRGSSHRGSKSESSPESGEQADGSKPDGSLSRPKSNDAHLPSTDKRIERTLMGSLTNSYKFKTDGLMKKTFSVTIGGVVQHLISYYKIEDVQNGRLRPPSSLPELASLDISPEYLDKTHFRNPPKVEIGADGVPRYRGEADEVDSSPSILATPLSTGSPLLSDGRIADTSSVTRRGKRFEPYSAPIIKRPRRSTKTGRSSTPPEQPAVPQVSMPSANYVESAPALAANISHYPHSNSTTAPYGTAAVYYPVPGYSPVATHTQVYHPLPTGNVPTQHTAPRGPMMSYQYAYPPPSALAVSADHQRSSDTVQRQHTLPVHPLQQTYYPYPPQQHSAYAGAWPAYSYHTVPVAQPPLAHAPQSSIATAPEQTDPQPSTSSEGGDG